MADLLQLGDHGKNSFRSETTRAYPRVDYVKLRDQPLPGREAFFVSNGADMSTRPVVVGFSRTSTFFKFVEKQSTLVPLYAFYPWLPS